MAPCEDTYLDDPDDWFLPTPFAGWPPPGLPDSRPLAERPDPSSWLYLPPPPLEPGSPRARLYLIRDGAVPFAVVVAPYSEGELVPIRAGQVYPHGAVALGPDGCLIEVELAPPGSNLVGFVTRVLELGESRSNRATGPPLTLGTLRAAVAEDDGVTSELVALARAGDEARFRELASCVMPVAEIDDCWIGTRARLGLPA